MSNSNDPDSPPAAPTAIIPPIPVPPPPDTGIEEQTVSRETLTRRLFRFDMVLLGLMLLLAFFLGSFIASNNDILLHLALANPFGAHGDPTDWPHHAWLPSLALSALYEPFSENSEMAGIVAVAAKALVVVILASVLCFTRRRGQSWLLPITCTALAVLVMSPRLFLQPLVLSLLLLAVTFWILNLPSAAHPRVIWWLPVVFVLWVNADAWFVLGPITVALFLVGEWLQRRLRMPALTDIPVEPGRIKHLGLVLLAGTAACLANPWTYRAITLPMELAHLTAFLPGPLVAAGRTVRLVQESDAQFLQQISPLTSEYWSRPGVGQNAAGLAYFILLLLGVASFAWPIFILKPPSKATDPTNNAGFTLSLFMVFLFFALLSILTFRMIPLFAVVAGPIVVLNFQDLLRRIPPGNAVSRKELNWVVGLRGAALLVGLLLVVSAWAGWLHSNADNWRVSRHVAWGVAEDAGIQQAAATLASIQKSNPKLLKLGVNYGIDGGNVFVWTNRHVSPGVNLVCDNRYSLYDGERGEAFGKIRKALRDETEAFKKFKERQGSPNENQQKRFKARTTYQDAMRKVGSNFLVFTNLHRDQVAQAIAQVVLEDPFQWVVLFHDGRTAVFGWHDPKDRRLPFAPYRLDLTPLAVPSTFPPNSPQVALKPGVPPPPTGPRNEWDDFLFGPVQPGLSSFQADALVSCHKIAADFTQMNLLGLVAEAGGPVALAGMPSIASYNLTKDPGPPGGSLLAMRAARNGVLESPFDPPSYLELAKACGRLLEQEERWVRQQLLSDVFKPTSLRVRMRYVSLATALQQCLVLQPNDWRIHVLLGDFYQKCSYLDLAFEHLSFGRDKVDPKLLSKMGDQLKAYQEEFKVAAAGQSDPVAKFLTSMYRQNPQPKDPRGLDRFEPRGLVKTGLKILTDADPKKLEGPAVATFVSWQIWLMLMTGQAESVRDAASANLKQSLPPGEYEELQAMAALALGDYAAADQMMADAEKAQKLPPDDELVKADRKSTEALLAIAVRGVAGIAGEDGWVGPSVRLGQSLLDQVDAFKDLGHLALGRIKVAEARLVRGLLALEVGNMTEAAKHFRGCLRIAPILVPLPDAAIAKRYVELLDGK